ncbi:hypothetical protein CASFOL_019750 [Castilleja foliolosa]|uniref:Uncharacterized protein n=1 Tax=Castilleja foliolosa TaxID=1961234 RepID=A0ABD3CYW7_9LAMI
MGACRITCEPDCLGGWRSRYSSSLESSLIEEKEELFERRDVS